MPKNRGRMIMGARQTILDPSQNSPEVREFEKALRQQVVGQDRAVRRLARVYQVFRAGLSTPGRPIVNLLFLGPTGSGKTRLVEATADALFEKPDRKSTRLNSSHANISYA